MNICDDDDDVVMRGGEKYIHAGEEGVTTVIFLVIYDRLGGGRRN